MRIHNWEDYLAAQVVAEFERRFNAKVEVVTFSDEEEALEQLSRSGTPFDLVVLSGSAVRRLREASQTCAEIDRVRERLLAGYLESTEIRERLVSGKLSAAKNAAAVPFMDKELLANPAVYPPDEIAARLETLFERGASAERDARRKFVGDIWITLAAKKNTLARKRSRTARLLQPDGTD